MAYFTEGGEMGNPRLVTAGVIVTVALIAGGGSASPSGSGWKIQSTPHPANAEQGFDGVSCPSATSCTAVGSTTTVGPVTVTLAEHWNGTGWPKQATPNPPTATNVMLTAVACPTTSDCMAIGQSAYTSVIAEQWNGSQWKLQSIPTPSPSVSNLNVRGISCPATNVCMLVGTYNDASGAEVMLAEQWNGTAWKIVPVPAPSSAKFSSLNGVSCASTTDCIAVGGYGLTPSCCVTPLSEHWDGTTWSPSLPTPVSAVSDLIAVSCAASTSCDAVGSSSPGNAFEQRALDEHWDGSKWTVRATPDPAGAHRIVLSGVSCSSPSSCTAVGGDQRPAGFFRAFAEGWNGATWALESVPAPTGVFTTELFGVSCFVGTGCTAVGNAQYTDSRGTRTLAERHS